MLREAQFLDLLAAQERRPFRRVLRRTWWLLLLLVAAGVGGGWTLGDLVVRYEAQSTVTAVRTPLPVEDTNLAQNLFSTDSVLAPVVEELDLSAPPRSLLTQGTLDADTIEGGALAITGRADDRNEAIDLSNAAARSFKNVLEDKNLGSFDVFAASDAFRRQPRILAAMAGGVIGGLLGAGALLLFLAIRQPILAPGQTVSELLPDAVFLARVHPPLRFGPVRKLGRHQKQHGPHVLPQGILSALASEIESGEESTRPPRTCFVVVGRRAHRDRRILAFLKEMEIDHHWSSAVQHPLTASRYWIDATDKELGTACLRSEVLVVVVAEWVARMRLQRAAEEFAIVREERQTILLMLSSARPGQSLAGRRDSGAHSGDFPPVLRSPPLRGSSRRQARST